MMGVFADVSRGMFRDADGVRIPAISEGLSKPSLLAHTAGTVCIRFRAPFFMEKATRRKKPQAKRCTVCVGSKATCYFIAVSKFSPGLCSSSLLQSVRSDSAEPEAEHKDTRVLSRDGFFFFC